jgi:rod shape-determining protein MreB
VGGNRIDEVIEEEIKKRHGLVIGEQTAENIKIQIGSAIKLKRPETMEVNGRETTGGLPKNLVIDSDEVYEAIRPVLDMIIKTIADTLEMTPPELVADILDRGIILSGGASQLRNLNVLLTRELGVSTHVALEPQYCVVRGVGMAIENLEDYRRAIR